MTEHQKLDIERLEMQVRVYTTYKNYFQDLLQSLPCDVSIFFHNSEGRVKILDISQHMQPDQAGYHVRWFADSMVKYYTGKLQDVNQVLQQFNTVQD